MTKIIVKLKLVSRARRREREKTATWRRSYGPLVLLKVKDWVGVGVEVGLGWGSAIVGGL